MTSVEENPIEKIFEKGQYIRPIITGYIPEGAEVHMELVGDPPEEKTKGTLAEWLEIFADMKIIDRLHVATRWNQIFAATIILQQILLFWLLVYGEPK